MEELVSKGLVKAIGISNFSIVKTDRLLQTAKTVPAVIQVECNPFFQQQKLKEYCDLKGMHTCMYNYVASYPGLRVHAKIMFYIDEVIIFVYLYHGEVEFCTPLCTLGIDCNNIGWSIITPIKIE